MSQRKEHPESDKLFIPKKMRHPESLDRHQFEIYKKVWKVWKLRYKEEFKNEYQRYRSSVLLIHMIDLADTHNDGFKRVSLMDNPNKTYLVPIEDIILHGLRGSDIGTKYTEVENGKRKKGK